MEFDNTSKEIIGSAIAVHKLLGPGLLESAYEECLSYELINKGLKVDRQKPVPIVYKEFKLDYVYRLDMLVENKVIIELKSSEGFIPIYEAQILTYMNFSRIHIGLLINFNVKVLKDGLKRHIL
jgi:GxxExxY protein